MKCTDKHNHMSGDKKYKKIIRISEIRVKLYKYYDMRETNYNPYFPLSDLNVPLSGNKTITI
jgi:hypothetical protein